MVLVVGVVVAVRGAYPPHTLARTASAPTQVRGKAQSRHGVGKYSLTWAIGQRIDPPAPAIARNDGGSCHPHTKKAETEGIAIVEYLYRIGRERRAKLHIDF